MTWHKLTVDQANQIIEANKKRESIGSLEEFEVMLQMEEEQPDFNNVVGQDSLTRFDNPHPKKKRRNKKRRKKNKPSSSRNEK